MFLKFTFIDCTFHSVTNILDNPIIFDKIMELLSIKFVTIIGKCINVHCKKNHHTPNTNNGYFILYK